MLVRGKVWLSKSKCIFENLAFEDWLFHNHDWTTCDGLLIWSNHPAVVIGRHQNPWCEANVPFIQSNGIDLARRNSGGGTVYHDLANVNLSFLTARQRYNRAANLTLIGDCLRRRFSIRTSANCRDDLLLQPGDRKVSGTAARLVSGGRTSFCHRTLFTVHAFRRLEIDRRQRFPFILLRFLFVDKVKKISYHHLTLMVNVNQTFLHAALQPSTSNIDSKATASVKSKTGCLRDECPTIDRDTVVDAICEEFLSKYEESSILSDAIPDETASDVKTAESMKTLVSHLKDWTWIFGKTPPFKSRGRWKGVDVAVCVEAGFIVSCERPQPELLGQPYDMRLLE